MAEKEIKIEEKSKKKRMPPLKWIIAGIVGVAILSGGTLGYVLLKKPTHETPPTTHTPESVSKGDTSKNDLSQIFPLEKFVVNLNDPGGKQYLHTTIELESTVNGFAEELNSKMPQVKDAILIILSSKSLSDVQGIDGKISLRKELITEINKIMSMTKIRNLYFTEFVIQ
jgi:flagellar protein FliL